MCGILGLHDPSRLAEPDRVGRALARMQARGPDGSGSLEQGGWHLGVRRLAITDPAAGQPLAAPEGGAWIAFNGSIADADEERARVAASGTALATRNDAELALRAWLDRREDGIARLRGMFALAILDLRGGKLVLARDRFGEKPLFLAWHGGRVAAFASTVAALSELFALPAPGVAACAEFLARGWLRVDLAAGAARVTPLPPGQVLVQDLAGSAARLSAFPAEDAGAPWPVDEAPRGVRAAVVAAVGLKARAETGVGLFLSGGLDSSALAAACRAAGRSVTAFTLRCAGEPDDEVERAAAVAARAGCAHERLEAGPAVLDHLPALTESLGLPIGDPSLLLVHELGLRARSSCKVVLAGEGADELFLGYRRYALLPWVALLQRVVPRPLLAAAARLAGAGRTPISRAVRAAAAGDAYGSLLEVAAPALVAELVGRVAPSDGAAPVRTPGAAARRDLADYLPLDLLAKLDHGLMSAGVEGRCPFLDPAVVRAAARVPPALRRRKQALRLAFANDLPRSVLTARKRGFALPLDRWLRAHDLVPDVLLSRAALARPLFRRSGLEALVARVRAGVPGFGLPAFLACALELHLRSVDKSAHA